MNRILLPTLCVVALALTACSKDPEPKRPDTGATTSPPSASTTLEHSKGAAAEGAKKADEAIKAGEEGAKKAGEEMKKAADGATGK